jgi:chitodextrinase
MLMAILMAAGQVTAQEPAAGTSGFVSDGFAGPGLGSHWDVVRALGVGSAVVAGGRLELSVPAGVNHNPWTSNDSVRAVQSVADEDLSIEARFESVPVVGHQMQGLTVEQTSASFLRLEVHHNGSQLRLFASTTVNGTAKTRLNVALPALTQVYLQLLRSGDVWTLLWSGDGASWTTGVSFTHAMTAVRVGPFVGNYRSGGDAPAFTALVDYVVNLDATDPPDPPDPPDDTTPPQISGVSVVEADTSAQVSWSTDEPATGVVEYGATAAYGATSPMSTLGTAHAVTVTGLAADTTYHYRIVATDAAGNTATTTDATFTTEDSGTANGGPTIDLWYGADLAVGPPTQSQTWANVLGNVSDPDGVAALTYSLNGGTHRALTIGPDKRRLQWPGDFNVDVPLADLTVGDNSLTVRATDGLGNVTSRDVSLELRSGGGAPLPYTVNWTTGTSPATQGQVVDGKWVTTGAGVRTDITGYDRIIAVGDIGWSDYELTVPVTVHALGPAAYSHLSGPPLIGVGMRWNGHTAVDAKQPAWGWYPTGAFAWYRFFENGGRFVLTGNDGSPVQYSHPSFAIGTTYQLKVRAETLGGNVTRYQVRMWPAGEAEPAAWLSSIDVTGGPAAGGIALIAHQLDGTFGDVSVQPL